MIRGLHIWLFLFIAASWGVCQRMERNSFLNKHVSSTNQLVQQVKTDPQVRDRYLRHFSMDQEELVRFLSSLRTGKLDRSGTYTVYNAPATGVLRVRARKLKGGTPIFEDANGAPVLLVSCGNPLAMPLPEANVTPPIAAPTDMVEIQPEFQPTEVISAEALPPAYSTPSAPIVPAVNPIPIAHGGGGGFPWLLGLVPLLFTGGGGGSPPPVPEPTGMLVLGAGAAYIWLRKRRAR